MSVRDEQHLLDSLLQISTDAARLINEVYQTPFEVEFKAPKDPVTLADTRSNELICTRLAALFPGVPIVAEESAPATYAGYASAERVFFVDPLDGTREFIDRNGEFVIMIGVIDGGRPYAGVVHAPATGLAWAGVRGHGAVRVEPDGARSPIFPTGETELAKTRIVSTRSHRSALLERALAALGAKELIALGSAGLKAVAVADGSAEAYVAPGRAGSRWDVCAGEAIVEAAGGTVTDTYGEPIDYRAASLVNERGIVASNGPLHAAIIERIAKIYAEYGSG